MIEKYTTHQARRGRSAQRGVRRICEVHVLEKVCPFRTPNCVRLPFGCRDLAPLSPLSIVRAPDQVAAL